MRCAINFLSNEGWSLSQICKNWSVQNLLFKNGKKEVMKISIIQENQGVVEKENLTNTIKKSSILLVY
ncbi:MAG: hypothetical protein Sylvanvirus22_9 [Sylvanvirus sp.]|uniref:Uncharacterized protein n=1 Tax=Sylvanvirus sp. TaxID=2487774 RepID=A0A3G5AIR1_9VIRU|nr:MAG: hypothetical protein Sylvanvirus22_9 [Sylvanvirus sp.]